MAAVDPYRPRVAIPRWIVNALVKHGMSRDEMVGLSERWHEMPADVRREAARETTTFTDDEWREFIDAWREHDSSDEPAVSSEMHARGLLDVELERRPSRRRKTVLAEVAAVLGDDEVARIVAEHDGG